MKKGLLITGTVLGLLIMIMIRSLSSLKERYSKKRKYWQTSQSTQKLIFRMLNYPSSVVSLNWMFN